jgi:hypothetical protein
MDTEVEGKAVPLKGRTPSTLKRMGFQNSHIMSGLGQKRAATGSPDTRSDNNDSFSHTGPPIFFLFAEA